MSSDHQPQTLLMAWKTSSGVWSTEKAAVKFAFPAGVAVLSGALAGGGVLAAPQLRPRGGPRRRGRLPPFCAPASVNTGGGRPPRESPAATAGRASASPADP